MNMNHNAAPDATDLLAQLLAVCACSVHVTVNQHRCYYEPADKYLRDQKAADEVTTEVLAEMIARDTIIEVQAYVKTPVGFVYVAHYDIVVALTEALEAAKGY